MDCSLPGSPIHGIFQARVLEWVAIPFSILSAWQSQLDKEIKVLLNPKCGLLYDTAAVRDELR